VLFVYVYGNMSFGAEPLPRVVVALCRNCFSYAS